MCGFFGDTVIESCCVTRCSDFVSPPHRTCPVRRCHLFGLMSCVLVGQVGSGDCFGLIPPSPPMPMSAASCPFHLPVRSIHPFLSPPSTSFQARNFDRALISPKRREKGGKKFLGRFAFFNLTCRITVTESTTIKNAEREKKACQFLGFFASNFARFACRHFLQRTQLRDPDQHTHTHTHSTKNHNLPHTVQDMSYYARSTWHLKNVHVLCVLVGIFSVLTYISTMKNKPSWHWHWNSQDKLIETDLCSEI